MGEQIRLQVTMPWSRSWSKNRMWRINQYGRVYLTNDALQLRDQLAMLLRAQLQGRRVAKEKVYVYVFVRRADLRMDPANADDLVLDAVKQAIGVDDRWFAHSNDWEIDREREPLLTVTVVCRGED